MPVYWHRGRIFMWFPFLADTNILEYDIMSMPAIVIDGKVVLNGQVPTAAQVRQILKN